MQGRLTDDLDECPQREIVVKSMVKAKGEKKREVQGQKKSGQSGLVTESLADDSWGENSEQAGRE